MSSKVPAHLHSISDVPTGWGAGKLTESALLESSEGAEHVGYDNTSSGLTATDVQAAIDEIAGGGGGAQTLNQVLLTGDDTLGENIVLSGGGELQSNGPMILNYGGAGGNQSLQARATGNARGNYTIDLQAETSSNLQVTAGDYSVILGGRENRVDGTESIALGQFNTLNGDQSLALGTSNSNTGANPADYAYLIGDDNSVPDGAGTDCIALGYNNVSGGVSAGLGVGTCIAIGTGNTADGNDYFGGGPYPALAVGWSNNSSGINSVAIGQANQSTWFSTVCVGENNSAAGFYAVAIGSGNQALGYNDCVMGNQNRAASGGSRVGGENCESTTYGEDAYGAGQFSVKGDARRSEVVLRNTTVGAVTADLYADGLSAGRQYTLDDGSMVKFTIQVVGKNVTANTVAGFDVTGIAKRIGGVVTVVGSTITPDPSNEFVGGVLLFADSPNSAIQVQVTGVVGATIRWVATLTAARVL